MNLHEFQAKKILKQYGIPIPEFGVASTVEEAKRVAEELHLNQAVMKIQVHAGGRGKAGGVKFAKTKEEIAQIAKALIGMKMVNQQTGPEGVVANKVLISKPVDIAKEYYIGAVIDRDRGVPILIASPEGGMEIEEIAHKMPEKILKMPFGFDGKLRSYQLFRLGKFMGWSGEHAKKGARLRKGWPSALSKPTLRFWRSILSSKRRKEKSWPSMRSSASMTMRFSASPRSSSFYDPTQVSPQEAAAKEFDLAYIAMHGNIGCMVNGAGLAMATMDIIQLCGGVSRQLSRCGRGRHERKSSGRVPDHPLRSESESDLGEYFWRDHELRDDCRRGDPCGERAAYQDPDRCADGRDQCRRREEGFSRRAI